ncbi:hypothetical protein BH11PSE11_BH11PSE11_16700 [soil metagenome]
MASSLKSCLAALALFLACLGQASAASWTVIGEVPNGNAPPNRSELDTESIRESAGLTAATVRVVYLTPPEHLTRIAGKQTASMRVNLEFDCPKRVFREVSRGTYDAEENLLVSTTRQQEPSFQTVEPQRYVLYNRVCGDRAQKTEVQYLGEALQVRFKSIGARTLLISIADMIGLNVVAGDEFKNVPVDVNEDAISWDAILDRLVQQQALGSSLKAEKKIWVIASACRLALAEPIPNTPSDQRTLGLNSPKITSSAVLELLSQAMEQKISPPPATEAAILIRTKNISLRGTLEAIAAAQGWWVKAEANQGLLIAYGDRAKTCDAGAAKPDARPAIPISSEIARPSNTCTRRQSGSPAVQCEPLEFIPIESLRFPGFVAFKSRSLTLAAAIDPDGNTHMFRVGAYLGPQAAQVTRIDADGVVIKEMLEDRAGDRRAAYRTLKYEQ